MHRFDEVASATGSDVGDTGTIVDLGCHLAHQRFDGVVGRLGATGHHAGPFQGAFGATGDAHADVAEALALQLGNAPFRIGVERIAAVNQQVTLLKEGGDCRNRVVNGLARLDHHQDAAWTLQGRHELLEGPGANDVLAGATTCQKLIGFGLGAIEHNGGVAVALGIEDEVFPHHSQTDQAEMRLAHD